MKDLHSLSVIGAGSYGTALAIAVASKGFKVTLWGRNAKSIEKKKKKRENERYLPGISFPQSLSLTASLEECVHASPNLLVVVPSCTFASVIKNIVPFLTKDHRLAWATKGIEAGSGELLSTIASRIVPENLPLAALSGPTFAKELALGMPTAIAVAGNNPEFSSQLCEIMHTPTFRIYESSDFIGLQLGGAVKNVIAIGAGLSDGLGFGANARTALITRGLAEMVRLGLAMGATERGFMGLSGLGDLILTCTDNQSRNRRFGYMLGQGVTVRDALDKIAQVVEGYVMTPEIYKLAHKYNVQMPICSQIYEVICHGKPGKTAAKELLGRSLKSEC